MNEIPALVAYISDSAKAKKLAADAGTSTDYLYQIATGRRRASVGEKGLCDRIVKHAGGRVTRNDLRPDVFGAAEKPTKRRAA